MTTFSRWLLAIAVGISSAPLFAQPSPFHFLQSAGPYPVGLRVVNQYDHARGFPSIEQGRPLQTLIWYPALPGTQAAMNVGDYTALADFELHFDAPQAEQNHWRLQLKASSAVPLRAVRDAKAAKGRYPVVIYAPSDSSIAWENADLCEYLASHGYVVLATPSMGVSTRDMTDDLDGINAQARDISFLVTYAKSLPDSDGSNVAVVSWSWGGISSLFAAARDPRITALAQMDGSMRYYPGLVKKAGDVHPERLHIPLIFFTAEYPNFLEDLDKDTGGSSTDRVGPNVLNAWKQGDLFTVNMMGMDHGEFGAMFQRRKSAQRFSEDQVADYDRDDANTSYALVARYILAFLDGYLKNDASAKAFLRSAPANNGVPKHFMGSSFRPATGATPSYSQGR